MYLTQFSGLNILSEYLRWLLCYSRQLPKVTTTTIAEDPVSVMTETLLSPLSYLVILSLSQRTVTMGSVSGLGVWVCLMDFHFFSLFFSLLLLVPGQSSLFHGFSCLSISWWCCHSREFPFSRYHWLQYFNLKLQSTYTHCFAFSLKSA